MRPAAAFWADGHDDVAAKPPFKPTERDPMIEGLLGAIVVLLVINCWHLQKIREHVATIRGVVWKHHFGEGHSYDE
jgi:hypothetical protein